MIAAAPSARSELVTQLIETTGSDKEMMLQDVLGTLSLKERQGVMRYLFALDNRLKLTFRRAATRAGHLARALRPSSLKGTVAGAAAYV